MPIKRSLTPKEIEELKSRGIDVNKLPQSFTVYTPDEAADMQARQIAPGGRVAAAGTTLAAHGGSLALGGLGGLGGWAAGAALAPESGGLSFLIPLAASLIGGYGGAKAGKIAQEAIVPEATQKALEQRAAAYHQLFPVTTTATEFAAGAIAGGGKPTLRAPLYAFRGLKEGLANEGMSFRALTGSSSPVYKQALMNTVTGGALNTTINAGQQLVNTGKIDPVELAEAAATGLAFSEPSRLGTKINPRWKPLQKLQAVRDAVPERISPTGENIADVEAYQKKVRTSTDIMRDNLAEEVNWAQQQEEAYNAMQQEAAQRATDFQRINWMTKDPTNPDKFFIGDAGVKKEFIKRFSKKPEKGETRPEILEFIKAQNAALKRVPTESMRQELFEQDFSVRDPIGYRGFKQQQADVAAANAQKVAQIKANVAAENARVKAEEEAQQRLEDFAKAQKEAQAQEQERRNAEMQVAMYQRRQQQIAEEQAKAALGKPLTENQRRIISPESITKPMTEIKGQFQPAEEGDLIRHGEIIKVDTIDAEGRKVSFYAKANPKETDVLGTPAKVYVETTSDGNVLHDVKEGKVANKLRIVESSNVKKETPLAMSKKYGEWTRFQPAGEEETPNIGEMTPREYQRFLREAGKAGVEVGEVEGEIRTPQGKLARGVSYDPDEVGRRLVGLAKDVAKSDTGYHELIHSMLRDLDASADPRHVDLARRIRAAYGGEEPAAAAGGLRYRDTVEGMAKKGVLGRLGKYFSDVWNSTKVLYGSKDANALMNNLIRRMRQRHGEQDVLYTEPVTGGRGKTQYGVEEDADEYNRLNARRMEMLRSGKAMVDRDTFDPEFLDIWRRLEAIKNRQPGEGAGLPPKGAKFQPTGEEGEPEQKVSYKVKENIPSDDDRIRELPSFDRRRRFYDGDPGQYWMHPDGRVLAVAGHVNFSNDYQRLVGLNPDVTGRHGNYYAPMFDNGWKRVAVEDNVVYIEPGGNPITPGQLRTLIDAAKMGRRKAVFSDEWNPVRKDWGRPLWRNPELEEGGSRFQEVEGEGEDINYEAMRGRSIDRMIDIIDTGLYTGRDLDIVARELVQNMRDAYNNFEGPRSMSEIVDPDQGIYGVMDEGKGMDSTTFLSKYLPPITSGKDIGEGGGFGLAKGVVLGRPADFVVVTTAPDSRTGKLYTIKLMGTGEGWKQYARDFIKGKISEEWKNKDFTRINFNDNLEATRQPAEPYAKSGTIFMLQDSSFSFKNMQKAMFESLHPSFETRTAKPSSGEDHTRLSDLYVNPTVKRFNDYFKQTSPSNVNVHDKPYTASFDSISNKDYDAEMLYNPNAEQKERNQINVHVLSNGSWQFTTSLPVGAWGDKAIVPESMVFDIKPKVKAESSEYPFTVNRDALKDSVYTEVRKMFASAVKAAKDKIKSEYEAATSHSLESPSGVKFVNFFKEIGPDFIARTEAEAPVIKVINDFASEIFPKINDDLIRELEVMDKVSPSYKAPWSLVGSTMPDVKNAAVGGLTTRHDVLGVNLFSPRNKRYETYLNPYTLAEKALLISKASKVPLPEVFGRLLTDASAHEITHNAIRDEYDSLSRALTFLQSSRSAAITDAYMGVTRKLYNIENLAEQLQNLENLGKELRDYDISTEVSVFTSGKERSDWTKPVTSRKAKILSTENRPLREGIQRSDEGIGSGETILPESEPRDRGLGSKFQEFDDDIKYRKYDSYDKSRNWANNDSGDYWVSPEDIFVPVQSHSMFSREFRGDESGLVYTPMFHSGWKRVVNYGNSIFVETGEGIPLSRKLKSELIDYAIENGKDRVIHDAKPTETIWRRELSPDDDGTRYQTVEPSLSLPLFRSEVDKVRRVSPKVGEAFDGFYRKFTKLKGYLTNDIVGRLRKYLDYSSLRQLFTQDNDDFRAVVNYLKDIYYDGSSKIKLTPDQRSIEKEVRSNLLRSVKLKNSYPGLPKTETPNEKYLPMMPSREALDIVLNRPSNDPRRQELINDFLDYQENTLGKSPEAAKEELKIFTAGYSKQKVNLAQQFGPIDKAAGVNIPRSWTENNLIDIMSRFNNRYARRIAYHDVIENNDEIQRSLEDPVNGVEGNERVRGVMDDISGQMEFHEAKRQAISGLVRAAMLGPLTGAKDFVSNLTLGFQHQSPLQVVQSALHAWANMRDNIRESFEAGVNRHNIGNIEFGEGGLNDVVNVMRRSRDLLNVVQGRNFLEQMTRATAYGQGKWLAMSNLWSAKEGRLGAIGRKFLNDFAPGWEKFVNSGEFTPEKLQDIASRYVESVQGTYDYRGLPAIAQRGSLAPYLALARWNIEKVNNFAKYNIDPLVKGNPIPLLMSTLGMFIGGQAVNKLVEEVTNKKEKTPKWKELQEAREQGANITKPLIWKIAGLASLSGYLGMIGDMTKAFMDVQFKNRPQTYDNPLLIGMSSIAENAMDVVEAAQSGDLELTADVLGNFLEDTTQVYRLALNNLSPEKKEQIEKTDKYRDLRVFKQVTGQNVSEAITQRANPYMAPEAHRFKRTQDINEAMELLPDLINNAIIKAAGNPDALRQELEKIKRNSYQTMPSPDEMPTVFLRYLNFLRKTQGEDEATGRLMDYIKRNAVNRAKSSMIP